jgi:hypothetical protein
MCTDDQAVSHIEKEINVNILKLLIDWRFEYYKSQVSNHTRIIQTYY